MTPNEIRSKQFERKRGAYRIEEVGDYLIEVSQYVEGILEEKRDLEAKLTVLAEKVEEYRADEESLRAALIGAQKLGDSVVRDAKQKAEQLLVEASQRAEQMVSDARSSLDKEALALTRMQSQVATFRDAVLDMYRRQLEAIKAVSDESELPKVDIPAAATPSAPVQQIDYSADYRPQAAEPAPYAAPEELQFDSTTFTMDMPTEPAAQPELELHTQPERSLDNNVNFKRAERVDSFVLSYDELEELPEETAQADAADTGTDGAMPAADSPLQHRRRSNFGDLRFGEEYNLTRKD